MSSRLVTETGRTLGSRSTRRLRATGKIPGVLYGLGVIPTPLAVDALVRVRYSSHWSLDRPGCVWPSPDGWTVVQAREPGIVRLRTVLARSLPIIGSLDGCPE